LNAFKGLLWAEIILGILLILVPLLWLYAIPYVVPVSSMRVSYLAWTEVALGAMVLIVATWTLKKNLNK
jgi:hypothetical protein